MTNLSDLFSAGVTVLDDQIFDTSGTWTRPAIPLQPDDLALLELWGGGGGGSVYYGPGSTAEAGGGGGYLRFVRPAADLGASTPVTVGAGGHGERNSYAPGGKRDATAGGNSSVLGVSVPGGLSGAITSGNYSQMLWKSMFSAGGGGLGEHDRTRTTAAQSVYAGNGGDGVYSETSAVGNNGHAPGGGGGGATGSTSSTPATAGSGAAGRVRVRLLRGISIFQIQEFREWPIA